MYPSKVIRTVQKAEGREPAYYRESAIEPIDYIVLNDLDFCEGNVVKYVSRYKEKGGLKDLYKAFDYLQILIHREEEKEAEDGT